MCGICGIALSDPNQAIDTDMLRGMTDTMRHRGPDSHGFHTVPGIGLGVRRLSIIDLETGDQPISNEDGTVTVVCNGEIYNFLELRQGLISAGHRFRTGSDIEVIVHLYEEYGVECVKRLRGMFGFALWDAKRRALMLARDRLGIKPLYYAVDNDALYFGSGMKPILVTNRVERKLDVQALKDLFNLGFTVSPRTLFTRIRQLRPGHYLLYQGGNIYVHKYWDLCFPPQEEENHSMSAREWAEPLLEKLKESVRIHLRSDVPLGSWLSAGIDSSTIVGLMGGLINHPVQTFTLAFENPEYDEVLGQKTLDEFPDYNCSNHRLMCKTHDFELLPKALWYCEDPSTTGIEVFQMVLSEATSRRNLKVVLTGEGSDELFGGYQWFRIDKLLRPLARLPVTLRRLMLLGSLIPSRWPRASRIYLAPQKMNLKRYQHMIGPDYGNVLDQVFSADLRQTLGNVRNLDCELSPPDGFDRWHPFAQLQYYEMKLRLPDLITRQLDRASMAYSLEARVPFLDHELVEFCAQIPSSLKLKGLQEKYILRQTMRGLLPEEIVRRKKRGLGAPFDPWLREALPDFARELLSEYSLREKGYFNPEFVTHMLEQHRAGKGNYGRLLLGVLTTQIWDDIFMHNNWCKNAPDSLNKPA